MYCLLLWWPYSAPWHAIGSLGMGRNYFESYLYWWLPYARLNLRSSSLSLTLHKEQFALSPSFISFNGRLVLSSFSCGFCPLPISGWSLRRAASWSFAMWLCLISLFISCTDFRCLAVFSVWSFAEHHCVLLVKLLLVTVPLSLYDRLPFPSHASDTPMGLRFVLSWRSPCFAAFDGNLSFWAIASLDPVQIVRVA